MEQEIDKNKTTIIELLEPLIRKNVPFLHLCTKESSKDDFEFWHIVVDELQRGKLSKKLLINFGTKDNIFNKVLCFRFRLPYSLLDPRSRNNMNDNQEYFAYHYSHGFTFPLININFYKENLINIENVINFFIAEGVDVVFLRNIKLTIETEKCLFALQEKLMDRGVKLITHIRYNDYMFSDTTKLKNLIFIEKKSEYENICQIRNLCRQTSPRYYQCFQDCTLEIEKR